MWKQKLLVKTVIPIEVGTTSGTCLWRQNLLVETLEQKEVRLNIWDLLVETEYSCGDGGTIIQTTA